VFFNSCFGQGPHADDFARLVAAENAPNRGFGRFATRFIRENQIRDHDENAPGPEISAIADEQADMLITSLIDVTWSGIPGALVRSDTLIHPNLRDPRLAPSSSGGSRYRAPLSVSRDRNHFMRSIQGRLGEIASRQRRGAGAYNSHDRAAHALDRGKLV
jgi:hypothetical protein